MSRRLAAAVLLLASCDAEPVELPHDAARPVTPPPAAVPARAPRSASARPAEDGAAQPGPPTAAAEQLPPRDTDVSAAPKRYLKRKIEPLLRGRKLAHRVYRARLGPSASTGEPTAVVLVRSARPGEAPRLSGFAHSKDTRFDFPDLHDGEALEQVAAVMFRDVDAGPDREVIVLVSYQEEDPQAPPFFSNVVLDWDAPRARFVRVEQLEGEIEAFSTAGEVLAHLRRITPP